MRVRTPRQVDRQANKHVGDEGHTDKSRARERAGSAKRNRQKQPKATRYYTGNRYAQKCCTGDEVPQVCRKRNVATRITIPPWWCLKSKHAAGQQAKRAHSVLALYRLPWNSARVMALRPTQPTNSYIH